MIRHKEDLTIPTITYIALALQINKSLLPLHWKEIFVGYIIFNLYTLSVASFSKYKEIYLRVFIFYSFLPTIWKFFKALFIEPTLSLYFIFLLSVLYEFIYYEKPSITLILIRLGAINFVSWGMYRWLISTWILF